MQPETLQDLDLEHYQLLGLTITLKTNITYHSQGTEEQADPSTEQSCYLDLMLTYRADQHGTPQGSLDADN